MLYEYECTDCATVFEKVKHHSQHNLPEICQCGGHAPRIMSKVNLSLPTFIPDYNPGLGAVVKGPKHKRELTKQLGVEEIGNERPSTIHKESEKILKDKLSWKDV